VVDWRGQRRVDEGAVSQIKHCRIPVGCETGVGLIETAIGTSLILIVAVSLLPLGIVATSMTENEGHLASRTTEYAQDKLEQLLALSYGDLASDTTVFPASATGGTGLAIGGSVDTANPVAGYADYLDANGTLLPAAGGVAPAGWSYMRLWQIAPTPMANLKRITVTTLVASKVGAMGRLPQSTLVTLKTFPF
jgi:hypothetical protein